MEPLSLEDLRTWPGKAMAGDSSALRGLPETPFFVDLLTLSCAFKNPYFNRTLTLMRVQMEEVTTCRKERILFVLILTDIFQA